MLHSARFAVMNLLLIVWTLAALQGEWATAPGFVVQCARAEDDGAVFEVYRAGEPASPGKTRVSLRNEAGKRPFVPGDTFRFVTFEDVSGIGELLTIRGR